jgi:hypothetical protein
MGEVTGNWIKNNSERMEQKLYTNTYISDTIKELRNLQPEKKGYMGGTPTPIYASQMAEKLREINHEEVYL